jgi:hypothetical protein
MDESTYSEYFQDFLLKPDRLLIEKDKKFYDMDQ